MDHAKRLERAEKYLQKGKTESALEEYMELLKDEPNNEGVRQTVADLYISLNRSQDAVDMLTALFEKQSSVGDVPKAAITYKKLQRLGPPSVEQTHRYAQLVEKTNRKESIEAYQIALKAMTSSGNKKASMAILKRLAALDPTPANLRADAELAAELGDNKSAAESFLRLAHNEKSSGGGFDQYKRAFELDPSNQAAALGYGRALIKANEVDKGLSILEPLAVAKEAPAEYRDEYGRALVAAGRPEEAEPILWEMVERDPKVVDEITRLIGKYADLDQGARAVASAQRLEQHQTHAGLRREFVTLMKEVTDKHTPRVELLEYMVALYNSSNRESDYCKTLETLFELYYAAGNFLKAGDALDRGAEVDPYEPGHHKRLEMLRGKIDPNRFNAIANRFTSVGAAEVASDQNVKSAAPDEPTVLEDFMLQAEIFLQYGMRPKAVERLERVNKLFPREEEKNEKLRLLYQSAGMTLKYAAEDSPPPARPGPAAPAPSGNGAPPPAPAPARSADAGENNIVDNFAKVTEITRNIHRQSNVKAVLFTAVNDVGRHWGASRCVAALVSPGKNPSAALEYCAPGIAQSDVMSLVKLVGALQQMVVKDDVALIASAATSPELAPVHTQVETLGVKSVLAVPMIDGEEHSGVLILEQCDVPRAWRPADVVVLRTIADQMVLAVNNSRLRSLMKTLAVTDEKSGLLKRASYLDVLISETRRAAQQNSTTTLMLLHFGKASALVKEFGEASVEQMMQQIGQTVCSNIRQNDIALRYELTTIALVLADTNEKNATFVVDKMKRVLAGSKLPGNSKQVPLAVGIAEAAVQSQYDPLDVVTEVINRVESALEAARADGANNVRAIPAEVFANASA